MSNPVLIFGATGGIGSATTRLLASQGRSLHLVARTQDRLEALARDVGAGFTVADALDGDGLARAVDEAGGSLSGLVFAIGSIDVKPLKAAGEDDFIDAFRLNLVAAAEAVRLAAPALREANGGVVLFSSVAAAQGFANHAVIAAAKGAVEGYARAAATELAPDIRINCIAPSLVDTPLAQGFTGNEAMRNAIARLHPVGRIGQPEDVASAVAWLLGPETGWVTGQTIRIDGGRSTLRPKG